MKENIKELRDICQKPVIHSEGESWYGLYFSRKISIYITYAIVKWTKLSANNITLLFIIFGVIGDCFIASGYKGFAFWGTILLNLWLILDAVDGEVARYRKKSSLFGIYLDSLGHYLVNPGILFAIGYFCYVNYNFKTLLWFSVIGFLSMVYLRLFDDLYYLTISKTQNSNNIRYAVDGEIKLEDKKNISSKVSLFKKTVNILADDSVLVVILTLVFLINIFVNINYLVLLIFMFYLMLYMALSIYILYKNVKKLN